ncbi:unnamed protein product [Rhizophagus irregularis]|nr:unnamed protein product [Rhizophagus irregularis]
MSHESELPSLDNTDSSPQNESTSGQSTKTLLYKERVFTSWNQAFYIIESWVKQQDFNIIYNHVERNSDRTLRKRTIQCEHQGDYNTKSNGKQTKTKHIGYTWHINLSEPFSNNPSKHVYITTFNNTHSHNLNPDIIQFENNKQIPSEIMKEIEFLTVQCKMGATSQRQYLEAKFPGQLIYNNDLYQAIQYFRPQTRNDSNDAAKLYAKLLESSQNNPLWKVAIKFDDKNTLTHLFWMAPSQIELWYRYSDIVIQDVTCKTNRYDMALSLFVILDKNRNIRLVAQVLLIDETKESHEWAFKQINLATNNIHLQVMMTDADLAVHTAIRSTFYTTYPMHSGFHASSPIKSINAWIKNYIFNSNISLCELAKIIDKRQISEDKKHQLILWKSAIPYISTQISIPSFMFTSIDKKLEEYLPPTILDLQRNKIRQCVFYSALQVNQEVISEFEEYQLPTDQHLEDIPDARQITASCMISDVNKNQIMSMWTVAVENKLYYRNKDASKEPFLVASKFESDIPSIIPQHSVPFLTVIHQISQNSITLHERLTDIQLYDKITEDYLKDEEQNENVGGDSELDDNNELDGEKLDDDKENHKNHSFILNNPNKQTKSKERPKGTKRIKANHEKNSSSVISKQYKCSQCGSMGHNKRNCSKK